jgi:UDP-N-acetylglucosamine transferase subunit ALG13
MSEGVDLLVASSGGHLKQLSRLRSRLTGLGDVVWATPRSAQGESLLAGEQVVWLPYARPHDSLGVARAGARLATELAGTRVRRLISTGASPALSALPVALRHRAEVHYIESAARVQGPSVTGSVMRWVPGARCYAQYRSWSGRHWQYAGSVFDDFLVDGQEPPTTPRSVVVTFGMNESYGFPRLVEALKTALPAAARVLWQVSDADASMLPGADVRPTMPAHELLDAMAGADLVVSHAGCGSALSALEAGHQPLLVARQARFDEHVDDHQQQIADELAGRGLAHVLPVSEVLPERFTEWRRARVVERPGAPVQLRTRISGVSPHTS